MEIDDLYAMIPRVPCPPGCITCCENFGVPSRTPVEDERIKAYLKEKGMSVKEATGTRCPYVTERGCSIYPVRPFICRLYGTSPNYMCIENYRPERLLSLEEEEELLHLYYLHFSEERR
ncbi:YkgJ family cysteine cluster protein [Thermodesulforhabdus norvegica]|uniref:YkgJ family cysteine cluster protein n=1 Tax=Thermodesulforhabdus norvegica TaxID=39841 RepID=A0A1I4S5R4_9BACT|nr:YkgJ family cysteine cluster protein [Thermodesulforhabdus norvegica]SFM59789.1 hypothetical protein SAMN05660836_00773 [Thermodesulforhabdus norvegica]